MTSYDIVIVGGGPAGLAAAVSAKNNGIDRILILERDRELGGILNQCIHNGFGLHTFKEELTGPEYARRFINQALDLNIEYRLNTMVMDISLAEGSSDKIVTAMNRTDGLFHINAKTVILAMGCRERSRGALNIPGYRPAGIYSAGTAQRLVNIEGFMPVLAYLAGLICVRVCAGTATCNLWRDILRAHGMAYGRDALCVQSDLCRICAASQIAGIRT